MPQAERWPADWFSRLILGRKLNREEFADYTAALKRMKLEPDYAVLERGYGNA